MLSNLLSAVRKSFGGETDANLPAANTGTQADATPPPPPPPPPKAQLKKTIAKPPAKPAAKAPKAAPPAPKPKPKTTPKAAPAPKASPKPAAAAPKPTAKAAPKAAAKAAKPAAAAKAAAPKPKKTIAKAAATKKASKPTAKPAAKKAPAVEKVDAIIGIKYVKGEVKYRIRWSGGDSTWEPEDNVMDDDLIDEFEAGLQKKAYAGQKLDVGSSVEVKNVDEGFENSWASATLVKRKGKSGWDVQFTKFVDAKGKPMSESVTSSRLRLAPPKAPKSWAPTVGEVVEVLDDDCWWEARTMSVSGKSAELKFRVSDETKKVALGAKLRPCSWLKAS